MLAIHDPLFLLLLLPLVVLAFLLGSPLARRAAGPRRRGVVLALRCGSLGLLILAIAQPYLPASGRAIPIVFVADTSASITAQARSQEVSWLRNAPAHTSTDLVTFAGTPTLFPSFKLGDTSWLRNKVAAPLDAGQTNIESALRLALGDAPVGSHIVVLSDGLQTTGDARNAISLTRQRGVTIDSVLLGSTHGTDAALTRLDLPTQSHTGDALPLQITVTSNRAANATLTISQDGRALGQQSITLRTGDNPFLITLRAPAPGWHSYRAAIAMAGDTQPLNNALDAATQLIGTPRLLVVTSSSSASPITTLLSGLGFSLHNVQAGKMPSSATALAAYDAVVLEDVSAPALNSAQVAALEQAVRHQGLGLLVLGGAHSLTLGHYSQTTLETMLPVLSQPPSSLQQGAIALQLVLDRSGSMDDFAGNVPKISMARSAADIAVDFTAQHKDDLGLVSFDQVPYTLFPMQTVTASSRTHAHAIIAQLTADGGTDIYDALRVGLAQIQRSNAPYKHIILMTDGRSDPANYNPLLALAERLQVTVSTVGLGQDADVSLLQYMASRGKGRFYYTSNAADLPHIFAEESRLAAGAARITGTIGVTLNASSPVIRSLGTVTVPPVHGYTATVLKPGATADIVTQASVRKPDPILAQWQYGLGRVLVWTPGTSTTWAGGWIGSQPALWDDAVRWILRGAGAETLTPHLEQGISTGHVIIDTDLNSGTSLNLVSLTGEAQTPQGARAPVQIVQTGPGLYETTLPQAGPGIYRLRIQQRDQPATAATAVLAVPYPAEYALGSPDRTLLAELAGATGGRLLEGAHPTDAWSSLSGSGTATDLWWPLAAIALVLFMLEITIRTTNWGRQIADSQEVQRS